MNLDWARLTVRLSRFELLAFGGFIIIFAATTVIAAGWIDSLRPPADCFGSFDAPPPDCEAALNAWYSAQNGVASLSAGLLVFLSFAAGLFLGVPIVARELERGTSRLAWSLTPSRMRWFLARMVPILVVLAVLTFVAGVASDRFVAATRPNEDLANSFTSFGFRGLLVASRAVFTFAVAVVVGAIVGRALPAVILTAVIAWIGLAGGMQAHQEILKSEAIAIPVDEQNFNGGGSSGNWYFDQKFVLPDGTLVGWQYFNGSDQFDENGNPKFPMVSIVVPGERYRFVETREAVVLAGGSLVALLLAGFVVSRRRPG
jgi:hypothetical protein